jgi:hypothetical protein
MTTLRHLFALVLLSGACLLSMASLGLIFDGVEDDTGAAAGFNDNTALNGCYTQEGGSQINSYWFDGVQQCQNVMWNALSGSVSYGCTYQVADGRVDLSFNDGSSQSFAVGSADNGITLDGDLYSYSGSTCD